MNILDKGRYMIEEILKNFKNSIKIFKTILTSFNYFREFTRTIIVKLEIFEHTKNFEKI